ncbi:MAG: SPOR domain-containing protein [Holosporales bacterium]|jgi:cell division septation protein DedD|nr:SPOR domain-containing protein [Holosporales bacterium]
MIADSEQGPSSEESFQEKKRSPFFFLGIAGIGLIVFVILLKCLPQGSQETPVIRAPKTAAKVRPQVSEEKDPLRETSVYNRIASKAPEKSPEQEVKVLPPPEDPVPTVQESESMGLTQEEQSQLKNLIGEGEIEEEVGEEEILPTPLPPPSAPPVSPEQASSKAQRIPSQRVARPPERAAAEPSPAPISPEKNVRTPLPRKRGVAPRKPPLSRSTKGYRVQIASLVTHEHAMQELQRLQRKSAVVRTVSGEIARVDLGKERGVCHRVYVGPFDSKQEAVHFVEKLKKQSINALVVAP